MKILLKDVINTDSRFKDLLCSYYLKTIIFWLSEELKPSVWTPDYLIPCFMRCFRRLIYCVQYQVCPHYFIPENNMFEKKIEGFDRDNLIDKLRVLFSYVWRCILFSEQISNVSVLSCNVQSNQGYFYYEDINKFLKSKIFFRVSALGVEHNDVSRLVYNVISCTSKTLKFIHAYFMSLVCRNKCQSMYISSVISNKNKYKQYHTSLGYLLMNINHDTVSGWLMIVSFFYMQNQYTKSLMIISYTLSKCTHEKLFREKELSVMQRLQVKLHLEQKQGVVHSLKSVLVHNVIFSINTFIPMELSTDESHFEVAPVVYAHFLSFLCHYHLNNVRECRNSLRDLRWTITEDKFIGQDVTLKSTAYYCLGTALQIIGDNKSAKQVFQETAELYPHPRLIRPLEKLLFVL
ncbi:uncharacterized protein LOC127715224 [Mytilus californianus]|uniref:uncharacterized protein LOC127715224 n=1 Tax=Mytilus californianus TaxID=6549 RepID=UPI0022471FE2|nr:uncharacterized protein LOC127715224 [Mytilus californianus]XP_052077207.1 uncharacterized protein LOC127715224 [Mytilus californianus]